MNDNDAHLRNWMKSITDGLSEHFEAQKAWHEETLGAIKGGAEGDLTKYQRDAAEFAVYKDPIYPVLGLGEEAGEVAALFAKTLRKHGSIGRIDRLAVLDELGDVLWMLAAIASELDLDLQLIANQNINKLRERKQQGSLAAIKRA